MAMHLARRLEKAGIPVHALGILDAAAGFESENVDHTVSDNVVNVTNYYQVSRDNRVKSFGSLASRKHGSTKSIINIKVSVDHEEVDDEYGQALLTWVLQHK